MKISSLIGSFFSAILIAVVIFFVIFFFFPSSSQNFFDISYQSSKGLKELKEGITTILEQERVPKIAIDQYIDRINEGQHSYILHKAIIEGKELVSELAEIGKGIDFGSFQNSELGSILQKGLDNLSKTSSKQFKSLQKFFSGAMEAFK
ncbi:MAG: hypothetical protein WDA17_00990 [Sphaerochaetaceae bacterium]